jgi:hypothetical protein
MLKRNITQGPALRIISHLACKPRCEQERRASTPTSASGTGAARFELIEGKMPLMRGSEELAARWKRRDLNLGGKTCELLLSRGHLKGGAAFGYLRFDSAAVQRSDCTLPIGTRRRFPAAATRVIPDGSQAEDESSR